MSLADSGFGPPPASSKLSLLASARLQQ